MTALFNLLGNLEKSSLERSMRVLENAKNLRGIGKLEEAAKKVKSVIKEFPDMYHANLLMVSITNQQYTQTKDPRKLGVLAEYLSRCLEIGSRTMKLYQK